MLLEGGIKPIQPLNSEKELSNLQVSNVSLDPGLSPKTSNNDCNLTFKKLCSLMNVEDKLAATDNSSSNSSK